MQNTRPAFYFRISSAFTLCAAVFVLASTLLLPQDVYAFTYTKDEIITDSEFSNTSWLSLSGIQRFLEEQGSVLAQTRVVDIDSVEKSVAEIIYRVSQEYTINPMVLLVMAQKESSAITTGSMTYAIEHWILGYGRCDSCSEADAAAYRGIARQFESAGARFRNSYLYDLLTRGYTVSGWGVGRTKTTIDGIEVTPANDATAALYTYNPCVGAYGGGDIRYGCNSLFQKLWQMWNSAVYYPNGSLLQIGDTVYLIQRGSKRPFTSRGALIMNYDLNAVVQVSSVVGEQYPDGAPIAYPNYSLLQVPSGGVYMYIDGTKRPIASRDVLYSLGFRTDEIIPVSDADVEHMPRGPVIDESSLNVSGYLIQNSETGAVAYIDSDNVRHDIWSKKILLNHFPYPYMSQKTNAEFLAYESGDPLGFKDGTLVRNTDTKALFVISNGKKRKFPSKQAFARYGYSWDNVIKVPSGILQVHPTGKPLPRP